MTFAEITYWLYIIAMGAVIIGHFAFAWKQWCDWPGLCQDLTDLRGSEIEKTAFLGRSIASYNASIGIGLSLSSWLDEWPQALVQGAVLALICATAAVGASGTRGNKILLLRFTPGVLALILLVVVQIL